MHCWNQAVFGNKHTTAKKMETMKKKILKNYSNNGKP